jgi:hypothetical protein
MENKPAYKVKYRFIDKFRSVFLDKKNDVLPITAYFKYEIETKHHPYNLVFPAEPNRQLYENEIFNLLANFNSITESIECLKYHLHLYQANEEFLNFFRYELPTKIKTFKTLEKVQLLEACLDWIKDQLYSFHIEPYYIGSKAGIETHFEPQILVALFKFLVKECRSEIGKKPAFDGADIGISLLLTHFSSYKDASIISLQKKVGAINTNEYLTESLKKELRLLFHG